MKMSYEQATKRLEEIVTKPTENETIIPEVPENSGEVIGEEIQNPENAIILNDVKGKITFNDYSFNYPGSKEPSLKNISFEIKKGEIVGYIGPNGAGKSTTIKMLTGILYPTNGEISVMGINPQKQRKELLQKALR